MTIPTTSGNRRTDRRELVLHRNNFQALKHTGPLLRWVDLSPDCQGFLTQEFIANSRGIKESDLYRVYAETLHSWGVMCPHPLAHRLYDGFRQSDIPLPMGSDPWYLCTLCGARVVNRDP